MTTAVRRQPRAPGAHRPVPRGRHRGRRRRRLRRRGRLHRRRHAARRGGRRALRRLGLRHPVDLARRGHARAGAQADRGRWPSASACAGLMNVQFAYQSYQLYVLEVNPRGSRTVPFVSKATGVPLAQLATRVILGEKLARPGPPQRRVPEHVSVKEAVLPVQPLPRHRHAARPRDEVHRRGHGHRRDLPGGVRQGAWPRPARRCRPRARVFLSVCDSDKSAATILAQRLHSSGFTIYATRGTATALTSLGIPVERGEQGVPGRAARRRTSSRAARSASSSTRRSAAARAATATRSAPRRCARACRASPRSPAPRRRSRRSRRHGGRACRYTACRTCTRRTE